MSFNSEFGFNVQEARDLLISKIAGTEDAGFLQHMLAAATIHERNRTNYGTPAESFMCELVHHWTPQYSESPLTPELARVELEEFEENFVEMVTSTSIFTRQYPKAVAAVAVEVA